MRELEDERRGLMTENERLRDIVKRNENSKFSQSNRKSNQNSHPNRKSNQSSQGLISMTQSSSVSVSSTSISMIDQDFTHNSSQIPPPGGFDLSRNFTSRLSPDFQVPTQGLYNQKRFHQNLQNMGHHNMGHQNVIYPKTFLQMMNETESSSSLSVLPNPNEIDSFLNDLIAL